MLESKDCLTLSVPPDNESNIPVETSGASMAFNNLRWCHHNNTYSSYIAA